MGRDRNRELVAEYPWLDIGNEQLTLLDTLPVGWSSLILDMCKEIKRALPKELVAKYQVVEAKEKWYMLSKEVCMMCGAPKSKDQPLCDVYMEQYR